jgi:hypothetical protein
LENAASPSAASSRRLAGALELQDRLGGDAIFGAPAASVPPKERRLGLRWRLSVRPLRLPGPHAQRAGILKAV